MDGAMSNEHAKPERRPYTSAKREQAARVTRRRIRAAGEELFLRDGYVSTTMAAVARAAGVSDRTVYLAFSSKSELLGEIIRVGVRGDDQTGALRDREDIREVESAPNADELLTRFARASTAVMARAARFIGLGEAAADSDATLAAMRDRAHEAIRADMRNVASALAALGALRQDVDVELAADILFAIPGNDSVYRRLTDERGRSDQAYAEMIERALRGALLHDHR
jgi:AcrR family transcriptional regulator